MKKSILAIAALAILLAWALPRAGSPPSMAVRSFVTNRYTFFPGDYVYAVIDVTNASRRTFVSCSQRAEPFDVLWETSGTGWFPPSTGWFVPPHGSLSIHQMLPHSSFSFNALVWRGGTNQVSLWLLPWQHPVWPLNHLPVSIQQRLPDFFPAFLWISPKGGQAVQISTGPFSVTHYPW